MQARSSLYIYTLCATMIGTMISSYLVFVFSSLDAPTEDMFAESEEDWMSVVCCLFLSIKPVELQARCVGPHLNRDISVGPPLPLSPLPASESLYAVRVREENL